MASRTDVIGFWAVRSAVTLGALVSVWAAVSTGSMLVHGHPAYTVILAVTFGVCVVVAVRSWRRRVVVRRRLRPLRVVAFGLGVIVIAAVAWLVPSSADEPALAAMRSDAAVTVTEDATEIVLTPTGTVRATGVFFQPGATVDARAYAAVLRPLAEAGHLVVIPKQPLGIAFLSAAAFGGARSAHASVTQWVVGGHSLGGTVAAIDAGSFAGASTWKVVGLLLYASYPATDMSGLGARVLSVSGSNDGLATPAKIDASKPSLPADTQYVVIAGGVHAFFGDYGPQAGDGVAGVSHDDARTQIEQASVTFVNGFDG
ncbi:alpha/beta hydrolase [Subtercola sp. RTI3]|uniref:alpha/beta hydrolase n=1 Tax=Subtercola sp. RTI3 TaxID=3048639 RepID=UPI002B238CFD|nr:alpha/beta hydrolase [Subtercola sp. RTI3]MEA9984358.1 alpha/beta hydrolase [Subtercola sp. RTI3]